MSVESVTTRRLMVPVSTVYLLLSCTVQMKEGGKNGQTASGKNIDISSHCGFTAIKAEMCGISVQVCQAVYLCAH